MLTGLKGLHKLELKQSLNHNTSDSDITIGTESLIPKNIDEIPSGPNTDYTVWISQKFNNLPYCPVNVESITPGGAKHYSCYITSTIEDIDNYLDLLEALASMTEQDTMSIYIDSPGGFVCSGVIIASFIVRCKGTVTTIARGLCASAGSLIWSAGQVCIAEPFALFMWHMSIHGDNGNSLKIKNDAQTQVEYVKNILLNVSLKKGHLTEEEVEKICTDPDYVRWIPADEMIKRMAGRNENIENITVLNGEIVHTDDDNDTQWTEIPAEGE